MTELTENQFYDLNFVERNNFIQVRQIKNSKGEWMDVFYSNPTEYEERYIYRLYMENTANEMIKEFGMSNENNFFWKLINESKEGLSKKQIQMIQIRLKYERYSYYQKGLENGRNEIKNTLKKLLDIEINTNED